MKIKTEYPYHEYTGYIVVNKENRRHICLVHKKDKSRTTISYARYLMSVSEKRILEKDEHVDHIDNDKTNDVLGNLQILSIIENNQKSREFHNVKAKYIELICPVCGSKFERRFNNITTKIKNGKTPCCSRKCGGIHSHK